MLPDALHTLLATARQAAAPVPMVAAEPSSAAAPGGMVAVIPVSGTVSYRASFWSFLFGGAVIEKLQANLRAALTDPNVRAILLRIDSPGGMVAGVPEFAAELRQAREQKPIIALADTTAASAAYWIGAQATEFWAVPSAEVGSVGVYAIHEDLSKLLAEEGVTVTLISAGPHKTDGNPYEPLSEDARADMKASVDEVYEQFLADVAAGRRVPVATVRDTYGQGRVLSAKAARDAGMVDQVGTFTEAVNRAAAMKTPRQQARADADDLDRRARQHRIS
jgi:signal peptide peptidase SppA